MDRMNLGFFTAALAIRFGDFVVVENRFIGNNN